MPRYFMQDTPLAFWEREMMIVPGFDRRQDSDPGMPYTPEDYHFPQCDGCFIGKLVSKRWNNSCGINCFFVDKCGHPYILCAWRSDSENGGYSPAYSSLDVSQMPLGTLLRVTYRINRAGKCKWLDAQCIPKEKAQDNYQKRDRRYVSCN